MDTPSCYVAAAAWSQVIASMLFVAVLVWLWLKFVQPAILTAQANANKAIAEAERHRDEMQAALEELRQEAEGARRDAAAIEQRAQAQAQRETAATFAGANEEGDRALRNAGGELDRARVAARETLRDELLEATLTRARAEAARRVDSTVNARLVDSFVDSLERGARN